MREIKFRAWDNHREEMFNPEKIDFEENMVFDGSSYRVINDRVILLQYTGLCDKNGVEIYEGDIVAGSNGSINGKCWTWGPYEIKYLSETAEFNVPVWGTEKRYDSTHWFEVIGNIYEHKHLIDNTETKD